jgi:hypothetical protein
MASTTPPTDPGPPGAHGAPDPGAGRAGYGPYTAMGRDIARLPVPGNAEFLFFVALEIFLAILLLSERWDVADWARASTFLGVAYLLSRGIAKASRVLEH